MTNLRATLRSLFTPLILATVTIGGCGGEYAPEPDVGKVTGAETYTFDCRQCANYSCESICSSWFQCDPTCNAECGGCKSVDPFCYQGSPFCEGLAN